jgi:hypothetical protein
MGSLMEMTFFLGLERVEDSLPTPLVPGYNDDKENGILIAYWLLRS